MTVKGSAENGFQRIDIGKAGSVITDRFKIGHTRHINVVCKIYGLLVKAVQKGFCVLGICLTAVGDLGEKHQAFGIGDLPSSTVCIGIYAKADCIGGRQRLDVGDRGQFDRGDVGSRITCIDIVCHYGNGKRYQHGKGKKHG